MQAESTTSEPEEGGDAVLELPPILDTLATEELLAALRGRGPGGAVLDAAAVERVSTGAVQILLAAALDGAPNRRRFRLRHSSPALVAGFADLGLAEFLDSWVAGS